MQIRHILVTTDLSPESLRPTQPVADLARTVGARVTLLHVVQELAVAAHGAPLAPPLQVGDTQKEIEHAKLVLEEQVAAYGDDIDVRAEVVSGTSMAETVCQYASEHEADLIALSTHGRTGLRHLVLGSVAEAVIRHSAVPVLSFPRA